MVTSHSVDLQTVPHSVTRPSVRHRVGRGERSRAFEDQRDGQRQRRRNSVCTVCVFRGMMFEVQHGRSTQPQRGNRCHILLEDTLLVHYELDIPFHKQTRYSKSSLPENFLVACGCGRVRVCQRGGQGKERERDEER